MTLEAWLSELDLRNVDNVARTHSYLELYTHTREHGPGMVAPRVSHAPATPIWFSFSSEIFMTPFPGNQTFRMPRKPRAA